ncbi:carboxymuconolactone decarboxylase family protein, partial [Streptomyces sp. NPDC000851]
VGPTAPTARNRARPSGRPTTSASSMSYGSAWRDTELFTPAERAALALAEAVTSPADATAQESAYASARETLTEDQISAVIWVAITINAFNRVSIMSKHPVRSSSRP